MNTTDNSAWNEVGDRLGSLGLKLKYHAEQAVGAESSTVNDAFDNVRDAIEEAFAALRGVVTDPAIRDDVRNVADGVAQAISTTLRGGFKHSAPQDKKGNAPKKAPVPKKSAPTTKLTPAKKAAVAKKESRTSARKK